MVLLSLSACGGGYGSDDYGYDDHGYDDYGFDDHGYDDYGYDDHGYDVLESACKRDTPTAAGYPRKACRLLYLEIRGACDATGP